jgi:hypothetical protein
MRQIKLLWYDITGYLKVRKIVRKHKKDVDFAQHNLRNDWVNRVYTVINPSESDKGDSPEVIQIKAQEKILKVHKYIDNIGLGPYVSVSVEPIPETNSYLLVYYPLFNVLSTFKVVVFLLLITGGIIAYSVFF